MPFVNSAEEEPNLFNENIVHGLEGRDCEVQWLVIYRIHTSYLYAVLKLGNG